MLDYLNIINDPFPDVQDEVTGEWLPKSAQQVRQEVQARKSSNADSNLMASILTSLIK